MAVIQNGTLKMCKAAVKSPPPNTSFLAGWMPFLLPNQQCQSTKGKLLYSPVIKKLKTGKAEPKHKASILRTTEEQPR